MKGEGGIDAIYVLELAHCHSLNSGELNYSDMIFEAFLGLIRLKHKSF